MEETTTKEEVMAVGFSSSQFPIFLVTITFLLLLLRYFTKSSSSKKQGLRLPPSPPALPVIGHLHLLRPPLHQAFHNIALRYGPLVRLRLGSTPGLLASSPESARELLKTNDVSVSNRAQSIAARKFAYDSAGFAFAPYGPYWRFVRRLCMSELLGGRTIELLAPIRRRELKEFLSILLNNARSKTPTDISCELIKMTNNVITRMVASTTTSGVGGDTEMARKVVKQVAELIGVFNASDHISFLKGFDVQGLNKRIEDVHTGFDKLMEKIIKEKEEMRSRKKMESSTVNGEEVKDLLDIMLDVAADETAEVKLTRENIKGFVLDTFTAGSDSSAASVEWALAELINHPDMMARAKEEIEVVVGKDRLVEESDIPNMPYIQAVVKEILRLHPAAPLIIREATKDIQIGEYHIPAGTNIFVNVWSVNKDPNHWEAPFEFRPERFLAGEKNHAPMDYRGQHFEFMPFGSGRRVCPGISLALQVIPVTLAALLQCFEWSAGEKGTLDMNDGIGMVVLRAEPLVLVPVARLDPIPSIDM